VKRFCAILLLLAVAGLGSGALRHVHDVAHEHHDLAAAHHHDEQEAPVDRGHHDATNCAIHAKLNTPLVATAHVPLLIALGMAVTFVTQLAPTFVSRFVGLRLDCRSPPAC
jgi:hypothetical protein